MAGLGKVEDINFQKGYQPGVGTDGDDEPEKLAERICFMKPEDENEPFFRIVADHGIISGKYKGCTHSNLVHGYHHIFRILVFAERFSF